MTNRRIPRAHWVVAILAVGLTGCDTTSDSIPEVATAHHPPAAGASQNPGASALPSADAQETRYAKALRYTRCMTDNGVKMADPVEGKALITAAGGANTWVMPERSSDWISIPADTFNKCKQFLPDSWPVKEDPAQLARERPFVECMRKHGVSWPEPDADGTVNYPVAQDATPEYLAAEAACRHLYVDAAQQG